LLQRSYGEADSHVNHTILRWLNLGTERRVKVFDLNLSKKAAIKNFNAHIGFSLPTRDNVNEALPLLNQRIEVHNIPAVDWAKRPSQR